MASKGTILITGVNGYIASQCAKTALEEGYIVRGSVRSLKSAEKLVQAISDLGYAPERLEIIQVLDISLDGVFDEAVRGITAVLHCAAPVNLHSFKDSSPILRAAVQGTASILKSVHKHVGPGFRCFVQLSTVSTVNDGIADQRLHTEEDWNTSSDAKLASGEFGGFDVYRAGKTRAEKALWEFCDRERPEWAICAVNPCYVLGPPVVPPEDPEDLYWVLKPIWQVFSGQELPPGHDECDEFGANNCVHVRDLARVMMFAVKNPDKAIADCLRKAFPERRDIIKEGTPGYGYRPGFAGPEDGFRYENTKAVELTGQDWIGFEEMVLDTAKTFGKYV